jgi:hypothetical protein
MPQKIKSILDLHQKSQNPGAEHLTHIRTVDQMVPK